MDAVSKREARSKRRRRIRKKVFGTPERPRLSVFRSSKHMYAQIIDDVREITLVSASTVEPEIASTLSENPGTVAAASVVGKILGERAAEAGIEKIVFDRGGYTYHGRVKALAEGAREAGLDF